MQVPKRQLGLLYSPPGSSGGKEPISKSQNSLHADKPPIVGVVVATIQTQP